MLNKLDNVLYYAHKKVPFYKDIDIECFNDIPIVTKKLIKENYELFLSSDIEERERVLAYLYGDFKINNYVIESKIADNIILEWTTGTSGVPFKCIKSIKERKQIALNMWKYRMKVDKKIISTSFYPMIHTGNNTIGFDIRDYSRNNIESLYSYIKKNNIVCIHTTPNLIKRHIEKSGVPLSFFKNIVPYIEMTGNFLSVTDKEYIEKVFEAKILNLYGLIEVWGIAYGISDKGFDIMNDNVKLELLDENHNIIEQEEVEGDIVVTSLNQYLMPFIRYSTGDRGKYIKGTHRNRILLCKDRNINMLNLENKRISGTEFAKKILRKIYWKKDFPDIKLICIVFNKKEFFFVLNVIKHKEVFEKIAHEIIVKEIGEKYNIKFTYVTEKEFEHINPKHYIFLERQVP